eukprot:8237754-Pyramimonas_sp.AAC.1
MDDPANRAPPGRWSHLPSGGAASLSTGGSSARCECAGGDDGVMMNEALDDWTTARPARSSHLGSTATSSASWPISRKRC